MNAIKNNAVLVLCLLSLFVPIWSCSGGGNEKVLLADTTFLESGVKYVFLKRGDGPKVDSLTGVTTHINLIIGTDTVWSTYAEDQEKFDFYAQRTSLIAGFNEVVMHTREGDRILAIIPPELGYGESGSGERIPPNSILHFDIEILEVEAPKIFLSDHLYDVYQKEGIDGLVSSYAVIKGDSINYNLGMSEWYGLNRKIAGEKNFQDLVTMWDAKLLEAQDMRGYYFKAQAHDSLGQVAKAIGSLEQAFEVVADTTGSGFARRYYEELRGR